MKDHEDFRVEVHPATGGSVVAVQGDVDLFNASELRAALDAALAAPGAIVVDLCGCSFIDSSGMRAVLGTERRASAQGRAMSVAATPGGVPARLLEITAAGILPVSPSRDRALALTAA